MYFKFNDISSNTYNLYVSNIEIPLPQIKNKLLKLDNINGNIDYTNANNLNHALYEDRIITLTITVIKDDDKTIEERIQDITEWLYNNSNYSYLEFSNMPNKYYYAKLERFSSFTIINSIARQSIIQFRCKPFSFGEEVIKTEEITASKTIILNNEGNWYCNNLYITATGSFEKLGFKLNNKSIIYNNGCSTGDTIKYDFLNCYVTKNDIMQEITGDFFELQKGNNNVEIITNGTSTLNITYSPLYIY